MENKLFDRCPSCGFSYDKYGDTLYIVHCHRCDKIYCQECNNQKHSLIHQCGDGVISNSYTTIGVTKTIEQKREEREREQKSKRKNSWW